MQIVPTKLIRISRYYMIAAIIYLLVTMTLGVCRVIEPFPNPMLHWAPAVLGWISFALMGAYYQFFPTLQGQDLRFENASLPQFALANAGLIGIIVSAWSGSETGLRISTVIYVVASLMFATIILGNTNLRRLNLTLRFYLASLTYFIAAIALLFLQAIGTGPAWASRPFLLHLFAFGWAVIAIMGAEYSMVPMLQLKDLRYPRLANFQFVAVNVGFWGLAYSLATSNLTLIAAMGTVVLAAIGIFVFIIASSLRHGPSRLPRLDISVKYFVVGIAYLLATALTGILMAAFRAFQFSPIHVHLGLIGLITITIVGAMYHIVPFVVWWEIYAPKLGLEEVPLLHELYSQRSATWQLYGLNLGLLLMVAGFAVNFKALVATGGVVLIVAALAFTWEMLRVLGHRRATSASTNTTKNAFGGVS